MWNRNKRENGGHRPASDEGFEPPRHKIRAQADIGKGDNPADHENDERADHDWKNESGFAFHCFPLNARVRLRKPDLDTTLFCKSSAPRGIRTETGGSFKAGPDFGKESLSLTESALAIVEASLKKLLAFSGA